MRLKTNALYIKIITIGINSTVENNANNKIKLLNIYALTGLHFIVTCLMFDYFRDSFQAPVAGSHILGFIVMLSVFKLHKLQKHNIAKTIWMFYAYIHFYLLPTIFNTDWHLEYYVLLIPCFALSLYNNINISKAIFILSFVLFLMPTYTPNNVPYLYEAPLKASVLLGVFVMLFMLVLYYKKQNRKSRDLLIQERDKALLDRTRLEAQEAELLRLNAFKSHFFVNISHEIRSPFTLIQGYTNQLNIKNSDQENKQKTNVIKEQCREIQNILNRIIKLRQKRNN